MAKEINALNEKQLDKLTPKVGLFQNETTAVGDLRSYGDSDKAPFGTDGVVKNESETYVAPINEEELEAQIIAQAEQQNDAFAEAAEKEMDADLPETFQRVKTMLDNVDEKDGDSELLQLKEKLQGVDEKDPASIKKALEELDKEGNGEEINWKQLAKLYAVDKNLFMKRFFGEEIADKISDEDRVEYEAEAKKKLDSELPEVLREALKALSTQGHETQMDSMANSSVWDGIENYDAKKFYDEFGEIDNITSLDAAKHAVAAMIEDRTGQKVDWQKVANSYYSGGKEALTEEIFGSEMADKIKDRMNNPGAAMAKSVTGNTSDPQTKIEEQREIQKAEEEKAGIAESQTQDTEAKTKNLQFKTAQAEGVQQTTPGTQTAQSFAELWTAANKSSANDMNAYEEAMKKYTEEAQRQQQQQQQNYNNLGAGTSQVENLKDKLGSIEKLMEKFGKIDMGGKDAGKQIAQAKEAQKAAIDNSKTGIDETKQNASEISQAKDQAAELKNVKAEQKAALEEQKAATEQKLEEAKTQTKKAEDGVKKAEDGVKKAEDGVKKAEDGVQKAEKKVDEKTKTVQQKEQEVQQQEQAVQQQESNVQAQEGRVTAQEGRVTAAEAKLSQAEATLAATPPTLPTPTGPVPNPAYPPAQAAVATAKVELATEKASLAAEKAKLQAERAKLQAEKAKLESKKAELQQAKTELNTAKQELTEAKNKLTEAKNTLTEAKNTLTEAKNTLKQCVETEKTLTQEVSKLGEQIQQTGKEIDEIGQSEDKLGAEKENLGKVEQGFDEKIKAGEENLNTLDNSEKAAASGDKTVQLNTPKTADGINSVFKDVKQGLGAGEQLAGLFGNNNNANGQGAYGGYNMPQAPQMQMSAETMNLSGQVMAQLGGMDNNYTKNLVAGMLGGSAQAAQTTLPAYNVKINAKRVEDYIPGSTSTLEA